MKDCYTRIFGKVLLLSQEPHTMPQIGPNKLNQHSLLDYSEVLKITMNQISNITVKTDNDKNLKYMSS